MKVLDNAPSTRLKLAQSVLITHVKGLVTRVQEQLTRQLKGLDRADIAKKSIKARGAIIQTKSLAESIARSEEYAAEHLVLAVEELLDRCTRARGERQRRVARLVHGAGRQHHRRRQHDPGHQPW